MRENSKQFKVYLKGILDGVDEGGTANKPVPDEENISSIAEDLLAFINSLSETDKLELSIIAKVVED